MGTNNNRVEDELTKSRLTLIRGLPFPSEGRFLKGRIENAMDYRPNDGDVIICTYPKSGTTWVQYIARQILTKGESFPSMEDANARLMPFMEMVETKVLHELQPPRLMKTHLPYHLNTLNPNAKYIYVYRNPRDTLTSYFYFYNERRPTNGKIDFSSFFEYFMNGDLPFGNYFDHVLGFYGHREDRNVLFISYESLKDDNEGQILRIARFLGDDYYETLKSDPYLLENIIKKTSFDYMKTNLFATNITPDGKKTDKVITFFRKGIKGDGKTHLSDDQDKRLIAEVAKKMDGTNLLAEWLE